MPRTGPRRVMVTTKVVEEDVAALETLAAQAGVSRSDVVRAGVEFVLRGVDRDRLLAYLAEVGREAPSGALTLDRRARLVDNGER